MFETTNTGIQFMRILQTNKRPRTTLCWNGTKKTWCVHYIWPQLKRLRVSIWSHLITGINCTSCKKREDRNGGNMGYCYRMGLRSYVCWFIIPSKYSYLRLRHRLQFHHPSAPTTSWRDDVGPETLRALNNHGLNLNQINIYIYIFTYVYMCIIICICKCTRICIYTNSGFWNTITCNDDNDI